MKNEKEFNYKKLTVNITQKEYDEIKELVQERKYLNASEFIREAIRLRLERIRETKY